jgi:hypothetical protein
VIIVECKIKFDRILYNEVYFPLYDLGADHGPVCLSSYPSFMTIGNTFVGVKAFPPPSRLYLSLLEIEEKFLLVIHRVAGVASLFFEGFLMLLMVENDLGAFKLTENLRMSNADPVVRFHDRRFLDSDGLSNSVNHT